MLYSNGEPTADTARGRSDSGLPAASDVVALLTLARDRSSGARKALAFRIGDLFADNSADLGAREHALMTDILGNLIRAFERDIRRELASRLAPNDAIPRSLLVLLANDEIEIAGPVLRASKVLEAEDLVEVVRHQGAGHQRMIAGRDTLSEGVCAALVKTKNTAVIETLLRNPGARIDQPMMAHLVEEARWVESYREPLTLRHDLPPDLARRLYWLVSAALRERLVARFDLDPSKLDAAMETAVSRLTGASGESSAAPRTANDGAKAVTPELLIKTLRRGRIKLFEEMFAHFTGLRPPYLQRVLYGGTGQDLAIACRGLGIKKADFAVILFLTRRGEVSSGLNDPRRVASLMDFFERVHMAAAEKRLREWRLDPNYLKAIRRLRKARETETESAPDTKSR